MSLGVPFPFVALFPVLSSSSSFPAFPLLLFPFFVVCLALPCSTALDVAAIVLAVVAVVAVVVVPPVVALVVVVVQPQL